jgi:5-dehydro-2-deoxygluconokinase
MALARAGEGRVVLDIDYRPVLWGLAGHCSGALRYVPGDEVTQRLQQILPDCDIVVGTEEELQIAGGATDLLAALRRVRMLTRALIVMKRGPLGAVAFPAEIPNRIEDGILGRGFAVEVYNVLGAGDAFMAGFLRGHLKGEGLDTALAWGNACGAIVVSRHGCAPAIPTWAELNHFLAAGVTTPALRHDRELEHLHWATTRRGEWPEVCALAFDHRAQLERLADRLGQPRGRLSQLKLLIYRAAVEAAGEDPALGIIVDERHGREVLDEASGTGCWIARPIESPERTPLAFEGGGDVGLTLREWPVRHTVKVLLRLDAQLSPQERALEEERMLTLFEACRLTQHELLVELIDDDGPSDRLPAAMNRLYGLGLRPDWWKLAPPTEGAWAKVAALIEEHDPHCRGVLLLGFDAAEEDVLKSLSEAARQPICKGFAIGRTIFGPVAKAWLAGAAEDAAARAEIGRRYARLIAAWRAARGGA